LLLSEYTCSTVDAYCYLHNYQLETLAFGSLNRLFAVGNPDDFVRVANRDETKLAKAFSRAGYVECTLKYSAHYDTTGRADLLTGEF
jgi:hypothetical protein